MKQNDHSDQDIPEYLGPLERPDARISWMRPGIEPFYACPIGTALWEQFRALHPEAPDRPPCMQELCPAAGAFFEHTSSCGHCLAD